jgi:hypothetical protein
VISFVDHPNREEIPMSTIRRFPGLYCLVTLLALLGVTLGCKDCHEHDCDCNCSEPDPGVGGAGGEAGAPSVGGEGGEAGGEPVLRPGGDEVDELGDRPSS